MPELNWACTACEIVVSRKTIAARWFSQHTNFVLKKMLCSKAKTRRLWDGCSGILRKANPQVCRAGGLQPNEMVCQRHLDKIRREDDRRCSCPSTWGHSSRLHGHHKIAMATLPYVSVSRWRRSFKMPWMKMSGCKKTLLKTWTHKRTSRRILTGILPKKSEKFWTL